jgi:hypothetical protein
MKPRYTTYVPLVYLPVYIRWCTGGTDVGTRGVHTYGDGGQTGCITCTCRSPDGRWIGVKMRGA